MTWAGREWDVKGLIKIFRESMKLNGSAETYRNFFWYQGYMIMVLLAITAMLLGAGGTAASASVQVTMRPAIARRAGSSAGELSAA